MKQKYQALVAIFACVHLAAANAQPIQWKPGDPGGPGMPDLRTMHPIEGCMVPGGLQRITSTDEPGSGAFWCGTPPHCLTDAALPGGENCTIVPYSRRDPRGNPNGRPGANSVRVPDDLRCVNTGNMPVNGRCPLPPPPPAPAPAPAPKPKPPSGGGSGSGGTNDTFLNGCNAKSYTTQMNAGHQPDPSKVYCEWSLPTMSNGQAIKMFRGSVKGKPTGKKPISCVRHEAIISTLSCNNGKHVLAAPRCFCSDGQ